MGPGETGVHVTPDLIGARTDAGAQPGDQTRAGGGGAAQAVSNAVSSIAGTILPACIFDFPSFANAPMNRPLRFRIIWLRIGGNETNVTDRAGPFLGAFLAAARMAD